LLLLSSSSPVLRFNFLNIYVFVIVVIVTSEDVCYSIRNVKLIQLRFLDHALSICNVCNRCLLSFPFEIEMDEEQEYLGFSLRAKHCLLDSPALFMINIDRAFGYRQSTWNLDNKDQNKYGAEFSKYNWMWPFGTIE